MRMHASWFGSQRPTGYKVAARTPRAATASSPRTRHPDHTERAAVLGSIKARPGNDGACGQRRAMADLDSPCARRPPTRVGRGEKTGFQVEQRNWNEGSGECEKKQIDFESLIQAGCRKSACPFRVRDVAVRLTTTRAQCRIQPSRWRSEVGLKGAVARA